MVAATAPELTIFGAVVVARIIVPLLILRWPLAGVGLAIILDFYDFGIFGVIGGPGPFDWELYQALDKVLDTYYLALLMWVVWQWDDVRLRAIAYGLFLWRLAGVVAFVGLVMAGREVGLLLFIAPNIFEAFVVAILFFRAFFPHRRMSNAILLMLLLLVGVAKFAHEYDIHVAPYDVADLIPTTAPITTSDRVG